MLAEHFVLIFSNDFRDYIPFFIFNFISLILSRKLRAQRASYEKQSKFRAWRSALRGWWLIIVVYLHLYTRTGHYDFWGGFSKAVIGTYMDIEEIGSQLPDIEPVPEEIVVHNINVTKCVMLHNRIVEYALERLEFDVAENRPRKNWFAFHGAEAENTRRFLSAPVVEFLENIYVWDTRFFSLTPNVNGVGHPWMMIPSLNTEFEEYFYEEFPNSIILYKTGGLDTAWESRGLIFDMTTNLVSFYHFLYDSRDPEDVWIPFETALEYYWSEVSNGNVFLDPAERHEDCENAAGWSYRQSDSERAVARTVRTWNLYIDLILLRTPTPPLSTAPQPPGLIDPILLDKHKIKGFMRLLLTQMRRPPFAMIAPGVQLISEDLLSASLPEIERRHNTICWNYEAEDTKAGFLLFATKQIVGPVPANSTDEEERNHQLWRTEYLIEDRCGVYVGIDQFTTDDVTIVAPMESKEGRSVLHKPDGKVETSLTDREREKIITALRLEDERLFRLHNLLAVWYDMVREGKWRVGERGVEGSLEVDLWAATPDALR